MTEQWKQRPVLILGGAGFIGSNLAIRLCELGARVTVVDSMLSQYGGNLANLEGYRDRIRINYSDIRDTYSLSYLVRDFDVIYSMAGQTSHIASMEDPFTDLDINCSSQLSILEACRAHNPEAQVIYASTRQLYGKPEYLPVDEQHPIRPVDVNGINKFAAEMYYSLYWQVHGQRSVSLRLTNTYGPRMHLRDNLQGFVGIFLRQAMNGEAIRVFGDGTQRRDFNYIDDVVDAFLCVVDQQELYGQAFNLGHQERYSILQFLDLLNDIQPLEYSLIPFPESHKKIDIGDYYSDFSRMQAATGWQPKTDLGEGLARTVEYFRGRESQYW